jgi:hypothetical protein
MSTITCPTHLSTTPLHGKWIPDVSWFRPFGCRVRGRDNVDHHKLSARCEPCIYVGLGSYAGHKGWLCYSPQQKRLFCTRNCIFSETFMPMRVHYQHILGFFDTTPRRQMHAAAHGDHLWPTNSPQKSWTWICPWTLTTTSTSNTHLSTRKPPRCFKMTTTPTKPRNAPDNATQQLLHGTTLKSPKLAGALHHPPSIAGDRVNLSIPRSGGINKSVQRSGGTEPDKRTTVATNGQSLTRGCNGQFARKEQGTQPSGGTPASNSSSSARVSNVLNAPAGGNHQHTGGREATFDIDKLEHITIKQATDSQLCEWLATRQINLVFQKYFYQQGPLKGLV